MKNLGEDLCLQMFEVGKDTHRDAFVSINWKYLLLIRNASEKRYFLVYDHTELVVKGIFGVFFFFCLCVGPRCSVPTERSCLHPWIWSIMDRTPTASQAGITWGGGGGTWNTSHNSASSRTLRRRWAHAWPPISTNILQSLAGCDCLKMCSKTHTHAHKDTHSDRYLWRAADLLP